MPAYAVTPRLAQFEGEHLPGNSVWRSSHVHYLSDAELPPYRIDVRDGLLYRADGSLFDTADSHTHWSGRGRAIFVMHGDGAIYSAKEHLVGRFHHSSLGQGKPVAGAGELEARDGVLTAITDHSSHYCPPRRYTEQVLSELARGGVDLTRVIREFRY
ncbi:hypothetical protein IEQ11_22115 [Lysobacter capsici]|uniref:hypothetical protein n=1 Tax=Lysobacter capsici TaxID=435897 RepID=UPI00178261D3|nr:hypothetical protein [Lysobacter capsici]UOF14384.1 hypothetical protein IEQ11_22115 [Lysobacter capsici]